MIVGENFIVVDGKQYRLTREEIAPCLEILKRERLAAESQSKTKENTMEHELRRIADALERMAAFLEQRPAAPTARTADAPALGPKTLPPTPPPTTKKRGAAAATPPPAVEPAPGVTEPTEDDVRDTLREYVKLKGEKSARNLLAEFGIGKLSEVKPEQYGPLHARMMEDINA